VGSREYEIKIRWHGDRKAAFCDVGEEKGKPQPMAVSITV
jgi:hypothetical protein